MKILSLMVVLLFIACSSDDSKNKYKEEKVEVYSHVVGWNPGEAPKSPDGFKVMKFADGLKNPRWIYVAENGDIFVSEASSLFKSEEDRLEVINSGKIYSQNIGNSANRITLFKDRNGDGVPEYRKIFLSDLNQPLGMLVYKNWFYVANTDGVWRYPYKLGSDKVLGRPEKIMDLPSGGYNNHWTRNIVADPDGKKLYVSVGSASNIGEYGMAQEIRRANILQINPDGSEEKIYGHGLRNPLGMDFHPETKKLWTVVNERDELGDELVPDYMVEVKEGGFYGWPYRYLGDKIDPRWKDIQPPLAGESLPPDLNLGAHTSSMGLAFSPSKKSKFKQGVYIGQHGSWNSTKLVGYKVVFAPFKDGKPTGEVEDFLTGFIVEDGGRKVHGRPTGLGFTKNGAMLVADDAANTLWMVVPKK